MFSERVLIILRENDKKMIPKKFKTCFFSELRERKQLVEAAGQTGLDFHFFQMLLHAHLTSYQEPRGRHPCQCLTHSAVPDATENPLATAVNAFRFPSGVVRWHRMTFGSVLLFPDATNKTLFLLGLWHKKLTETSKPRYVSVRSVIMNRLTARGPCEVAQPGFATLGTTGCLGASALC